MNKFPSEPLVWSAIIGGVSLLLALVSWLRSAAITVPAKFFGVVALIMLIVGALTEYERHWIVEKSKTELKIAEGEVMGFWRDRVKRSGNSGYTQWEGFSVGDTQFVYATNVGQNYFFNAKQLKIHDGMPVKISYLEVSTSGKTRNEITRFEAVVLFP